MKNPLLPSKPLDKFLFLDIETTSQYPNFDSMPAPDKDLFFKKWEKDIDALVGKPYIADETVPGATSIPMPWTVAVDEIYNRKAPLHAEYNKIICISIGSLDVSKPGQYALKTVSICKDDEKDLLETFMKVAARVCGPDAQTQAAVMNEKTGTHIVAHNGLMFDVPVIAKRMIYNGITPPFMFRLFNLKPWDVKWIVDTKEYWKCGVFDGSVSLDQLCLSFGVPSSKSVMQGKDVKNVWWGAFGGDGTEKNIFARKNVMAQISEYCEADVLATCRVYLKMLMDLTPVEQQRLDLDKVIEVMEKAAAAIAAKKEKASQQPTQ